MYDNVLYHIFGEVIVTDDLDFRLVPAATDPSLRSQAYQDELSLFGESLTASGIEFRPRMSFRDSGGDPSHLGLTMVSLLGEYGIPIGVATASISALQKVLVEWIKAKAGRKIKVKVGDRSIEAGTVEEVERLLPQLLAAKLPKPSKS